MSQTVESVEQLRADLVAALDAVVAMSPDAADLEPMPDVSDLDHDADDFVEQLAARLRPWHQRRHAVITALPRVQAWLAAGDILAALAAIDPSEDTLTLGRRWANTRPEHAMPSNEQVKALMPMLIAHRKIKPTS